MFLSKKLLAILLLALLLRVIGIGFGLPALYHQDEPKMVNHAMAIGATGDWNTHYFVIPPFVSYLLFVLFGLYYMIGSHLSVFPNATEFAISFFRDPTPFYLIGRWAVGICFGVGTVLLVARIGAVFFLSRAGLWGALFLALSLVHVQHSHYIYADSPLTLAITLLCFYHLMVLRAPTTRNFIIGGVILGWATAIKYTALYFLPTSLFCYYLVYRTDFFRWHAVRNLALAGAASFAVFALLAPYTFLDWKGFYSTFLRQSNAQGYVGIFHYLKYSLIEGTSPLLIALSVLGIWAGWKSQKLETFVLGAFFSSFYLISTWTGQPFSRYVLPIVPIVCLWAGLGFENAAEALKRHNLLRALLVAAVLLSLAIPTVYMDWLYVQKDTRSQCSDWFYKNVKPDSVIVMDSRFYGPHIKQAPSQLDEKMASLFAAPDASVKGRRLLIEKLAVKDMTTYRIYTLRRKEETEKTEFLIQQPILRADAQELDRVKAEYILLNYTSFEPELHDLIGQLKGRISKVAVFSPYRDQGKKMPVDPHSSTAAPHLPMELYSRNRLGPYLEVYRIERAEL